MGIPSGLEDLAQGGHDRLGGLGRPELGVEEPLGGVVDDMQERRLLLRAQRQPGMGTAVEVEELAAAGAGRAPAPMPPPGPPLPDQARRLLTLPMPWSHSCK
jgi:hypothetical protein